LLDFPFCRFIIFKILLFGDTINGIDGLRCRYNLCRPGLAAPVFDLLDKVSYIIIQLDIKILDHIWEMIN